MFTELDLAEHGVLIFLPDKNAATGHLQRMFPFVHKEAGVQSSGRTLRVQAAVSDNSLPEVELAKYAAAGAYNDIFCGLLMGTKGARGTAFPVTPHANMSHWMTARHVTQGGTAMLFLTTNMETRNLQNVSRHYDIFHEAPLPTVPSASLRPPSEPDKPLLMTYGAEADIAAFTVTGTSVLGKGLAFFIPTSNSLQAGDLITLLGYPAKPDLDYATTFFATPLDYAMYLENFRATAQNPNPISKSHFQLTPLHALSRTMVLDDAEHGVFLSGSFCASPGTVHAANNEVVEHTCSSLPQMAGGPCVSMANPFQLVAFHIQGGGSIERNINYAVSVNHPVFVAAYVSNAVKFLSTQPTNVFAFHSEALPTLVTYLQTHKDTICQLGLTGVVEAFLAAHAPQ